MTIIVFTIIIIIDTVIIVVIIVIVTLDSCLSCPSSLYWHSTWGII